MLLPLTLLSLLAPSAVQAVALKSPPCSAPAPTREFLNSHREFRLQEANATTVALAERAPTQVNTYIHIIASDTTYDGGYIDKATINKQMQVLNSNYGYSGFAFVLRDTDYTVDPRYAKLQNSNDEYAIKKYLRRGNYNDLNLYYFVSMWTGNTGWCYYPTRVSLGDDTFIYDGCVLNVGTMPGGAYYPWNEGKITSHEVGHWFGLIHPFEGNCGGGDSVDDTPAEASPAYGCPTGRDTCSQPGLDPIHNYMDYTDNACQSEFTNGQIARMWSFWNDYRRAQSPGGAKM